VVPSPMPVRSHRRRTGGEARLASLAWRTEKGGATGTVRGMNVNDDNSGDTTVTTAFLKASNSADLTQSGGVFRNHKGERK
jgi:hypothetical protein